VHTQIPSEFFSYEEKHELRFQCCGLVTVTRRLNASSEIDSDFVASNLFT
jgi:hypothetical protein